MIDVSLSFIFLTSLDSLEAVYNGGIL